MSESVFKISETIQRSGDALGFQIVENAEEKDIVSTLLTDKGKKASAGLADFSEADQAKIKEVYGMVMAVLVKETDSSSTITKENALAQIEADLAPEPEPKPAPEE